MAEPSSEPDNLVLEQLRLLRNDVAAFRSETNTKLDLLTARVGSLEEHVALLHRDLAGLNTRMDNFDGRLARVERRLELVNGSPIA